jgi:isoleucyl-tRNA synthetase
VILDTTVTPELAAEGLARDVVRAVQQARRDAGFDVSDRIQLRLAGAEEVRSAIQAHADLIKNETLAEELSVGSELDGTHSTVGTGQEIAIALAKV